MALSQKREDTQKLSLKHYVSLCLFDVIIKVECLKELSNKYLTKFLESTSLDSRAKILKCPCGVET